MRLKQIKLAGFKSFVDVTKVPFPQQMTAIVGPNGCGKSNIIDAVRWVLGESSAKNLRGDAMTDVIFNGSSSRKPVGQASVELLFENQVGANLGEHQFNLADNLAERAEISVRRTVNRDGVNHYFLNGSKCRKKDITDVFLGSGLGPKSYAIIEQGMISRLIESKPQELRVFVEEAAGVSKYKERRRETENKLRATRENIQRLADISHEINLHLAVLTKQAEAAIKYRTLKAQERELKVEIALIKQQNNQRLLNENNAKIDEIQRQLITVEDVVNSCQQAQTSNDADIEQTHLAAKQEQQALNDTKQQVLLIEQQLSHTQQQQTKITERQQHVESKLTQLLAQFESCSANKDAYTAQLTKLQPQVDAIDQQLSLASNVLNQLNEAVDTAESSLQALQDKRLTKKQQELANSQATLEINQKLARLTAFHEEKTHQLHHVTTREEQDLTELFELRDNQQRLISSIEQNIKVKTSQLEISLKDLEALKNNRRTLESQLASLQAQLEVIDSQLAQESQWQKALSKWLAEQHLVTLGVYHQLIDVQPAWQKAVQKVLGQWLHAPVLSQWSDNLLDKTAPLATYWLIDQLKLLHTNFHENTLASVIKSDVGLLPILNTVYLAHSCSEAFQQSLTLRSGESVVTKEGVQYFAGGVTLGEATVEVDLLALKSKKQQALNAQGEIQSQYQVICEEIASLNREVEQLQKILNDEQSQLSQLALTKTQVQKDIEREKSAQIANKSQQQELVAALETLSIEIAALNEQQLTLKAKNNLVDETQVFEQQISAALVKLEQNRNKRQEQQQHVDQLKKQHQQILQQEHQQNMLLSQAQMQATSMKEQLALLEEQKTHWQEELALLNEPSTLNEKLSALQQKERLLSQSVDQINQQLAQQKSAKSALADKLSAALADAEKAKSQQHQLALKNEQLTFELNALNEQLSDMTDSASLPLKLSEPNRSLANCQKLLSNVSSTLNELGVVNLAAIEECQIQEQRKNQIDLQIEDLTQALATLESAIAKIDKESRAKFKLTFEQINSDFTALFPKVFGGGNAYLALTSDDMLDTGVTIMARPPGKKNSTIHLLSGGEKALTALSLVFAIFKLTPAPFCMLDEVDAPLDDANVERFCNLVQEMSKTVQFIYISHNKIAMEMASHLTGVTMGEPGVSRMVSVDIDEAIAMAEVS